MDLWIAVCRTWVCRCALSVFCLCMYGLKAVDRRIRFRRRNYGMCAPCTHWRYTIRESPHIAAYSTSIYVLLYLHDVSDLICKGLPGRGYRRSHCQKTEVSFPRLPKSAKIPKKVNLASCSVDNQGYNPSESDPTNSDLPKNTWRDV